IANRRKRMSSPAKRITAWPTHPWSRARIFTACNFIRRRARRMVYESWRILPGSTKFSLSIAHRPSTLERRRQTEVCRTIMLAKRIIPCLDVDRGRVVKGIRFVSLVDAGNPVEQAIKYDAE